MAQNIEASIEIALLTKAKDFAASVALPISLPNGLDAGGGIFSTPISKPLVQYLRTYVLPAPTIYSIIPSGGDNQYYGYLQIDVVQGLGGGSVPMVRTIDLIVDFFPLRMKIPQDGIVVQFTSMSQRAVSRGPLLRDGPWMAVPVSVPYLCFARPT